MEELKLRIAMAFGIEALLSTEVDGEALETSPKEYTGLTGNYIVYLERC